MSSRLLSPRNALLAAVLAVWFALAQNGEVFARLGLAWHDRWFLDSHAVLAANDAAGAGLDTTHSNPLDALNRPHVYSDWWLGLRGIGLTRAQNFPLAVAWALAFLAAALAATRPQSFREAAGLAVLLLSPPVLIALHRANNDLVIFTLLGLGALALRGGAETPRLAAFGALVVLATGLKYYPLAAAGALLVLPWRRSVFVAAVVTTGVGLLVLASQREAIARGLFALPATIHEFGAPLLWRDWDLGRGAALALALAILGAGGAVVAGRGWTSGLADARSEARGPAVLFAVASLVLLGCFVVGTNYTYRWIFGLGLWPWLWTRARGGSGPARLALAALALGMWADGLLCLVVNTLGLAYRPGPGWRLATQPVVWLLMTLLAGWWIEALRTRWREARAAPADRPSP